MRAKFIAIFFLFLMILEAKELEKVSLQLQWLNQFQFAGYYMAKERGFYKEVGLDVEIKNYKTDISIVDEIVSKKSTYGIGRSSLITDRSKGKKITLLSAVFQSSPLVVLATKDSNITTVKDFIGKRVMVLPDIISTASLQAMANKNGVEKKDLIKLKHSFNVDDLITKKTDLMISYLSNEPFLLKEKGIEYNVFNPKDYGFDFYSDILFTSEDEILNHKKRAEKFKEASMRGWEYVFSHVEESVELVYSKYNTQAKSKDALMFEANTLKKLAYYKTDVLGYLDTHKIQRIYDIYNVFGMVQDKIDMEKFIFQEEDSLPLDLSKDEKSWIKENPVVTYTEVDWKPLSIVDNGKIKGITNDFLNLISSKTGIKFKFVPSESKVDVRDKFRDEKVDMIPIIKSTYGNEELGLISSMYAKYPMVIVTGKKYNFIEHLDELNGKTIVIPEGYSSYDFLVKNYPKIKLKTTKTIQQALVQVEKGKVDAFVGHIATSLFYISRLSSSNLKISGISPFEFEHHYLIQQNKPELLSIINKAFNSITEAEKEDIYNNWVNITVEQRMDYTLAFKILVGLFLFLVFLLYRETMLSKYTHALEITQDQFNLGQKIANIGIWNFDKITNTLEWTDGVHRIFGTDSETFEVTFENFMDFVHPDDRDKLTKAYDDSIYEKRDYFLEHRIVLNDGSIKHVQERCQNFFDDEGNILYSVGTVLDISREKVLEEEVLQINKNLEEKVELRTKAIEERDEQLLQQSRMAQMGEMISMIAHQWRQPLGAISSTSIDMNLKLQLSEFDLSQKQERDKCNIYFIDSLEKIDGFVKNLTNTIDDFRNFYKPNKKSVTALMNSPVKKALSIVRASFLSDGIVIVEDYKCKNRICMHESELMQVILNILKNSQDNFKDKSIENGKIFIKTYDIDHSVRLEISDNGGGIPEDILQKIFDPYFSTKSEKNGTGLGLYMSKTIIQTHHNGKLSAKNIDNGVCFIIDMKSKNNEIIENITEKDAIIA